ncbi:MAG: FtsQ-type POTRA domain-containing protein, partial [Clostridia bacterium]|nr:FtsQ-type POTRA domain-containing protein [Clostridia bacterium]
DVRKNQFIFTVSDSAIEKRLRAQFPYIEDVEVELALPDTVNLIFTEDSALFYTQMYDEYFVISESMRVLARCDTVEELDPGLRRIMLPSVSYAVVGHELRFFDASYLTFLTSFLDVIEASDIYSHVSAMDLSNRFDIVLSYDDRLEIELGDDENLETRLLFIKSTIEALEPDDRGVIHIVDNKQAIFSPESRESK